MGNGKEEDASLHSFSFSLYHTKERHLRNDFVLDKLTKDTSKQLRSFHYPQKTYSKVIHAYFKHLLST
jgi:hypothetical protein